MNNLAALLRVAAVYRQSAHIVPNVVYMNGNTLEAFRADLDVWIDPENGDEILSIDTMMIIVSEEIPGNYIDIGYLVPGIRLDIGE